MRANADMKEEDKRKEIEEKLDLNMFVEAGAGAGKTTLIVSRIVNMLAAGVEPGEIVVITFTNAAAEELRSRIIARLGEKSKTDQKLEEKLHHLNDMNISTIHSFCNVLLHEQGLVTKLPVDIEMLQGEDELREKRACFDAWMKTLTKEDWNKLEEGMDKKENRFTLRRNMEALFKQIADLPEDTEIMVPEPTDEKDWKTALEKLQNVVDGNLEKNIPSMEKRLIDILNANCINSNSKDAKKDGFKKAASYDEVLEKYCASKKKPFKQEYHDVLNTDSVEIRNRIYLDLLKTKKYSFFSKSNFKTIIDQSKFADAHKEISEGINQVLTDDIRSCFPQNLSCKDENGEVIPFEEALEKEYQKNNHGITVADYAKQARKYYREHAKINQITNDRLLELARDLILNENKSALEYFSKKYTRYFVDEFQDTDRIQESFIYRLASDPKDASRLRDGALFVVGDPKQSIYRFRGAQPGVYFATRKKMEELNNAQVYELQYNYRSNAEIIEWVNRKFSEADSITPIVDQGDMPDADLSNSDEVISNAEVSSSYKYEKMLHQKIAVQNDNVIRGIYHTGSPDAEKEVTYEELRQKEKMSGYQYSEGEQEADIPQVVNLILNLTKKDDKGEGYFKITDYDYDENHQQQPFARDIKLSDFLLISAEKKRMADYVAAMQNYGIPVVLDGKEDPKTDKGLIVFVRLYQYLVNPRDSFYRMGAEEALRETLHMENEEELHRLSQRILDCLYEDARSMTAYGMAEYLERQLSVLFDKGKETSHVNVQRSQVHIRQMIESLCMNVEGTGIEMAGAMQKYLATDLEHELSLEEKPDAVHFMNLHKTKGLQGNIVILLDRNGKKDHKPVYCSDGEKYYPGVDKFWSSLSSYNDIRNKADLADKAEFHRLEYVAVTRAAQAVIFMDVLQRNGLFAKKKLSYPLKKEDLKEEYQSGPTIFKNKDDKTYSYEIIKEKNILEEIKKILPPDQQTNQPYEVKNARNYDVAKDDYAGRKEEKHTTAGMVVKESPSMLEKGTSSKKNAAIVKAKSEGKKKSDEFNWNLLRPVGNVAGDILHRSMELLVGRRSTNAGIALETSVRQAVAENEERLHLIQQKWKEDLLSEGYHKKAEEITEEDTKRMVTEFVTACAEAYNSWLDAIWQDVVNVWPEVHFSYQKQTESNPDITVWMNGTADLILEMKDGSFQLIDYKSDNDYLLSEDEMNAALAEKYTPQLDVYRSVIQTMLGVDKNKIKTGIVSFSQKDENGNLLPDKNIRVRYVELDESY